MQFALLGQHADGWNLARALVDSGRHQLLAYTGKPPAGGIAWAANARRLTDLEEILADPAMVAVIVAGTPTERPLQLRRALQSERHAFCVHPADHSADIAYEAALLQGDTKQLLLPVLPEATHPAFSRLVELFGPEKPLGKPRFLAMERHATGEVLLDAGINEHKPSVPGWDVLRQLGGEISEISAYAAPEELEAAQPVLLSGRFVTGGLFQISLLPFHKDSSCRLKVECDRGRAELFLPLGMNGPAFLDWSAADGERHEQSWDIWDPWPTLVRDLEQALATTPYPTQPWQEAIRCLELDDAVRRSIHRRRVSTLEYADANEEVGFKGTMTLVGCSLLWGILGLVILSYWLPWLGWFILPALAFFLLLQMLRFAVPKQEKAKKPPNSP